MVALHTLLQCGLLVPLALGSIIPPNSFPDAREAFSNRKAIRRADNNITVVNKGSDNGKSPDDICGYQFDSQDIDTVRGAWKESGAADWWNKFINDQGAEDWSNKFFKQVLADGKQGGSTIDCTEFIAGNCAGPGTKSCDTYNPPESFYMHIQMSNVFQAFMKIWMETVEQAVRELSSGIKQIVADYGTPPESDNGDFLNMLVGILTSVAGFGVVNPMIAGTTTAFAGIFASMSAGTSWQDQVSPETLNDKLESAYGDMFDKVMKSTKGFIEHLFRGETPGDIGIDANQWVSSFFGDANWLSNKIVNAGVKEYISKVQKKWDEFAVVKAMKSGNAADFFLMVSDEDTKCFKGHDGVGSISVRVDMSEEICRDKLEGCLWNDNRCICFGSRQNSVPSVSTQVHWFGGDDLKKFQGYVLDYEAALRNNYDCVKYIIDNKDKCHDPFGDKPEECTIPNADVPSMDDLNVENPLQYTKCWFNLAPVTGSTFSCGWTE